MKKFVGAFERHAREEGVSVIRRGKAAVGSFTENGKIIGYLTGAFAFQACMMREGFPLDLTELMARERGLRVDVPGLREVNGGTT